MTQELFHSIKLSNLTRVDLYSGLISLTIQVSRHVLQKAQTKCRLTHKENKEKPGLCQKHTQTAQGAPPLPDQGKQEHYSWPGPRCFLCLPLTSSPREPKDCTLIFITETSCQNGLELEK